MIRNKTYFFKLAIALLCTGLYLDAGAQTVHKVQKEIIRSYQIAGNAPLQLENYNCDMDIHTWEKAQVKVSVKVIATMHSAEDARILSDYMDDMEFKKGSSPLKISTRFWKSRNTRGKKTLMELDNGEEVRYRNFQISAELWIPEDVNLDLSSKYSVINLEDLKGDAKMNLYNDKVYARSVAGSLDIHSKYTDFEFTELNDVKAYLYSGELEAASSATTTIESKYSKFAITKAGNVRLDSYSDKFRFASVGDITFKNKYSDLDAGAAGNIWVDGYSSTLIVAGAGKVELNGKYGKYDLGKATQIHVSSSYNDKITVKEVESLEVKNSKYGNYRLGQISGHISLDNGYSDKILAESCLEGFKGLKMDGKYLVAELKLASDMPFFISANVKYPEIKIPEDWLQYKTKIKESSQLEMKASRGNPSEKDAHFDIRGYNVKLVLE